MSFVLLVLPVLVLLFISFLVLLLAKETYAFYVRIGEPILIHIAVIFFLVFGTFITGAIGLFLQLDQIAHPLFGIGLVLLSFSYVIVGFIYRSITGSNIKNDYLQILLYLAPGYGLATMIGLRFSIIPAIISQLIPLAMVVMMEHDISRRVENTKSMFKGDNEILLHNMNLVLVLAKWIHSTGILLMIAFLVVDLTGNVSQIIEIWGEEWQTFDYFYFVILVFVSTVFYKFYRRVIDIKGSVLKADITLIVNSLIE